MALVGSLEGGDRGNTTQKEKEEKGDMGLGKSIVLGVSTAFSYPRAKASTSSPAVLNLLKCS